MTSHSNIWRCDDIYGLGEHVTCHMFRCLSIPFCLFTDSSACAEPNDVFPRKEQPFGVTMTLFPIQGAKSPQNPHFGGVNTHLQAYTCKILKAAYYRNCCIDSTQILQCDKNHQILFAGGSTCLQKIQDGGGPPY